MQIHELDTYQGTSSSNVFVAVDDGTETQKVPMTEVGVTAEMTLVEAQTGTETDPRVISPAVLSEFAMDRETSEVNINTDVTSGDDYTLAQAISTLGWSDAINGRVLKLKTLLAKITNAFPRVVTTDGWVCLILNGYIICSQQLTLTPTSANQTVNREVALPYTLASTAYHIQMTPNSRVETAVFNYGAQRTATNKITLHMYCSTTTTRYFFVTVLGRLA